MRSLYVLILIHSVLVLLHNVNASGVQPLNLTSWVNKKVMMLAAHPDDIEGFVGGTVAHLARQNTQLFYVIVTNGDKGCSASFCAGWTTQQIAATRQQEALDAASVNNVPASNVVFLGYEDCQVPSAEQKVLLELIKQIRSWKPDVVMSFFPYPRLELQPGAGWGDLGFHPDHQAVGRISLAARFNAGVGLLYPELGVAHSPSEYYIWDLVKPTHYVDINATITTKMVSFLKHKSQFPSPQYAERFIDFVATSVAAAINISSIERAEGFIAYS